MSEVFKTQEVRGREGDLVREGRMSGADVGPSWRGVGRSVRGALTGVAIINHRAWGARRGGTCKATEGGAYELVAVLMASGSRFQ